MAISINFGINKEQRITNNFLRFLRDLKVINNEQFLESHQGGVDIFKPGAYGAVQVDDVKMNGNIINVEMTVQLATSIDFVTPTITIGE